MMLYQWVGIYDQSLKKKKKNKIIGFPNYSYIPTHNPVVYNARIVDWVVEELFANIL